MDNRINCKDYSAYLNDEVASNIYMPAFTSTLEKFCSFVNTCSSTLERVSEVLDAPMGHGKTTALTTIMKGLGSDRRKLGTIPLLLVFANKDVMKKVVDEVGEYGKQNYIPALVTEVYEGNVSDVLERVNQYQFVCITQQRFRDLALQTDNWRIYSHYSLFNQHTNKRVKIARHIICDEMPIFFNYSIFDVGSTNNCVEWFDELSGLVQLDQKERDFARNSIAKLLASEINRGVRGGTQCLKGQLDVVATDTLLKVLNRIKHKQATPELMRKLEWFLRLLQEDNVGHIDGQSIICSQWIDYTKMGNILILDGTSTVTNSIYEYGGYKVINVPNYHKYSKRLFINHMNINTSSRSRNKADKGVHRAISANLQQLRTKGINPFPLCGKADVQEYINNNAITDSQKVHFIKDKTENGIDTGLALNLLNVTGRNELSSYDSLAILNLPIRPPQFYRIMAVGLYGADIDTRTSKEAGEKNGRWFFDLRVEVLFRQSILADMSQIIHRTDLRNLKSNKEINIYMYHNQSQWNLQLQQVFNLPSKNIRATAIKNPMLHGFEKKCKKWAEQAKQVCMERYDPFNPTSITPAKVSYSFKKWLSENWSNDSRRNVIDKAFREQGLWIEENPTNHRKRIFLEDEVETKLLS